MAPSKAVNVAIIGVGGVGRAFFAQLAEYAAKNPAPSLSLVYLSSSKKCVLSGKDYAGLPWSSTLTTLNGSKTAPLSTTGELQDYLSNAPGEAILVDNTSDEEIANSYPSFLEKGIHIVTPNKKAFSSDIALWDKILASSRDYSSGPAAGTKGLVFHEATVGAGLPILSTLRELIATGDEVTRIEGIFSGTMSYIFNEFAPVPGSGQAGAAFSDVVKVARDLGYTEPDPRDDLNGLDVARKLTILARISGLPLASPTSFPVTSLIPKALESAASADEFLEGLPNYDEAMDNSKMDAEERGCVIRFVGVINLSGGQGDAKVGMGKFPMSHPFATLKGSDNIISFKTKRYGERPLIVQGAGAGADVTAMGVLGDFIKVLKRIS